MAMNLNLILSGNSSSTSRKVKFLPSAEALALEWVEAARGRTACIVRKIGGHWEELAYYANNKGTLTKLRYDHGSF